MAESVAEQRLRALEKQGQKSIKLLRLCLLVEAVMFFILIACFAWTADLKTASQTVGAAMSKRIHTLEEIAEKDINEKAIQRQEIAETDSKTNALRQDFDQLQDSLRLNEITKTEEDALSKTQVTVLQQEFHQFKENEKVLEREFEKMKQQLKEKQDEAARAGAALRQELTDLLRDKQSKMAFQLESTLMKQEMDRLKQNDEALKQEIESLKSKPSSVRNCSLQEVKDLLQEEFGQFIEKEQVLEREFEKMKQQLKQKRDEAARAGAELRQEMDHLKQNEEDLKREVEILTNRNKPTSNYSLQEVTELSHLLQQQLENVQILKGEFEKMKQQLKQTQDEASTATTALRQELIDLLRDKQTKTAFKLESTLMKQEMDRLKQNDDALKREIELLNNKSASLRNCSLQEVKNLLQQEFVQFKESAQILERRFEIIKQQLKQTQDEASTATAALRQELIDLLKEKQSKSAFQLESAMMKQEMERFKHNEEAMKQEIENKLANITPTTEVMELRDQQEQIQQELIALKHREQVFENELETLKQKLKLKQDEAVSTSKSAALQKELVDMVLHGQNEMASKLDGMLMEQELDDLKTALETSGILQAPMAEIVPLRQAIVLLLLKEQEANLTLLTKKQEADGEHLARDVAELWDRQELVLTAQQKIDRNEQLLKRELEKMNRSHKLETEARIQEIKELRHQNQALGKEVTDTQANLARYCSQTPSATEASKEDVEELIQLAQQGLSAGSVWRLLVALWLIFYLFIYHQKFRNEIRGKISELTEKQKTVAEYFAQRVGVDELKGNQESDRKQLVRVIYALVKGIFALVQVIYAQRQRMAEKEVSQLTKKLEAEITALKNRQEQIDVLNDHYIPALLPFHITVPLYILYDKPFYARSKPFYTHPRGYKMCLAVHANGMEEGKAVSVIIFLMQGVFDDELAWPFRGKITVYLSNQFEARGHQEIPIKSQLTGVRMADGNRAAVGIGNLSYVSAMATQYLKHNRLCFQIAKVELQDAVAVVPTDVTMTNFKGHERNSEQWYSEPFYTHPGGYKMRLNVHANGVEDAKGTHVSVFIHLMQRECDGQLKWPFRAEITIQLLNQSRDEGHWTETIDFDDGRWRATGVLWEGRCFPLSIHGRGKAKFIAHSQLSTQDGEYLINDCLRFRISKVVMKST